MDLIASDVAVALTNKEVYAPLSGPKTSFPVLTVGDGAKTCPAGGIPLPAIGHFGMKQKIKRFLVSPNGDGKDYVYNQATHKLRIFSRSAGGIQTFTPGGGDIKGSDNTDFPVPDQNAAPTNGDLIDTLHAVLAGPAWAYSEDLEPDVARNICILLKGGAGGSIIPAGAYTFTITGLFRGVAQTDTVTFTWAGAVGTIVEGKFRVGYGVKPFDKIIDVVITPAHLANLPVDLIIGVGIGSKLGLPSETLANVEADILKITKTGADLAVAGTFSGTNKTVNLGTLADGNDVAIQYQGASGAVEMVGLVVPVTVLDLTVIGQ